MFFLELSKEHRVYFRKLGIEWLYRLASDPRRIKRQLNLPRFLMKILLDRRN